MCQTYRHILYIKTYTQYISHAYKQTHIGIATPKTHNIGKSEYTVRVNGKHKHNIPDHGPGDVFFMHTFTTFTIHETLFLIETKNVILTPTDISLNQLRAQHYHW